jgi:hypothetical protein
MTWVHWLILWCVAGPALIFARHVLSATVAGFRVRRARKVDEVAAWGARRNSDVGGVVHRKGK